MSNETDCDISLGAQHAPASSRSTLALAATEGSAFNTLREPLVPVACWCLNHPGFAFDSSFVAPTFRAELATLSGIVAANPACPASLFGHCDPSGSDDLNKTLGDRRAIAIYALLTRQPELWSYLYDNPQVGDDWGLRAVQCALGSVPDPGGKGYYRGRVDGISGPLTTDAVKRFQTAQQLEIDGNPGKQTRRALFLAYMDWLCSTGNTGRFQLQPADFLGGTGAQEGELPKLSLQSCGEYNPVILLSNAEMNGADKATRNADNAANRRVMMLFFAAGTVVDPKVWPCPKVKEPGAACRAAFWPDGDARRKSGSDVREYKKTHDTMACRFYDRFARRSPCERRYLSLIEFFVYRDEQDGSGATTAIEAKWGDQLRLGWFLTGTAERVQIANRATGVAADVTFATGPTGDGYSMGWVPLCVVDVAAGDDGVAEYQLIIEWAGGRRHDKSRVQVTMTGAYDEYERWMFGALYEVDGAERVGLGRSHPVPTNKACT